MQVAICCVVFGALESGGCVSVAWSLNQFCIQHIHEGVSGQYAGGKVQLRNC